METFSCLVKVDKKYYQVRRILDLDLWSELSHVEDSLVEKLQLSSQVINQADVKRSSLSSRTVVYVSSVEITLTLTNLDKTIEELQVIKLHPLLLAPSELRQIQN